MYLIDFQCYKKLSAVFLRIFSASYLNLCVALYLVSAIDHSIFVSGESTVFTQHKLSSLYP